MGVESRFTIRPPLAGFRFLNRKLLSDGATPKGGHKARPYKKVVTFRVGAGFIPARSSRGNMETTRKNRSA
jgi:hypothetical protein